MYVCNGIKQYVYIYLHNIYIYYGTVCTIGMQDPFTARYISIRIPPLIHIDKE